MATVARRHDTEALRIDIREAALRLFAQSGYDGTSVQQVADAVGISKQLLLYHYPSKEALRSAVIAIIGESWTLLLPRLLEAMTSGDDRVGPIVDELQTFLESRRDIARVVMLELINDTGPVAVGIETEVRPWMQVAAETIRRKQADGTFYADVDPEAFVVQLGVLLLATIALMHVSVPGWPADASPDDWRRRRLREAMRMIKAGLLAR